MISRKQAIEHGLKQYATGKPCKNGHISNRLVSDRSCMECNREKSRRYHADNRDSILERQRKYREDNPLYEYERTARKRAAKLNRTPVWLTEEDHLKIKTFYQTRNLLNWATKKEHHVDHIIPLQGVYVSGLHVPDNLQVITAQENLKKTNIWRD